VYIAIFDYYPKKSNSENQGFISTKKPIAKFGMHFCYQLVQKFKAMKTTEERIEKIITDTLGLPDNTLSLETNLKTDLNTDSLDMVAVIVAIEKEFNIAIPDEHMERIQTVRQVLDYVNKTSHMLNL